MVPKHSDFNKRSSYYKEVKSEATTLHEKSHKKSGEFHSNYELQHNAGSEDKRET